MSHAKGFSRRDFVKGTGTLSGTARLSGVATTAALSAQAQAGGEASAETEDSAGCAGGSPGEDRIRQLKRNRPCERYDALRQPRLMRDQFAEGAAC
jgi:hypothetical protein